MWPMQGKFLSLAANVDCSSGRITRRPFDAYGFCQQTRLISQSWFSSFGVVGGFRAQCTHTHGTYSNTISLIYVIDSIGTACRKWEIYTRLYIARMQQSHTPPREKNPCAHFIYSFSCAKLTNARCVFVDKVRHLEEPIMVQYERETRFMFHFCFRFYLCLHRWVSCNSLIC